MADSLWRRLTKALRYIATGVPTDQQPKPPPVSVREPANEPTLPRRGPIPGLGNGDDSTSEREDRERLVRQVMEWFKKDGAYWDRSIGRWVNEHGEMRSPARLSTVVHNINDFTNIEIEFGLMMSREEWQDLASRIEGYWYH